MQFVFVLDPIAHRYVTSVGVWLSKKWGSYGGGGGGGGGGSIAMLVSPLPGLCISIGHNYLEIGLVYGMGSMTMPHGSITCTK